MAEKSSAMIGCSWTEVSVLGSQVFGQALLWRAVVFNWIEIDHNLVRMGKMGHIG